MYTGKVKLPYAPPNKKSVTPNANFNPFSSSAKASASVTNTGTLKLAANWPSVGAGVVDAAIKIVKVVYYFEGLM